MASKSNSRVHFKGIQLGDAVNLLHGADRLPIAAGPALVPPPQTPLRRFPVELDCSTGTGWRPPGVTLHHDVASLIERLCVYRVERLFFDGPEFNIRPGLLLRDDEDRAEQQRRLGQALGVELAEGRSYLLFQLQRIDGRADHQVTAKPTRRYFDRNWHLTPEWRRMSTRLRPGKRIHDGNQHDALINAAMAQRYVDCFYEFGTHFVSAVEGGDALVQVVALRPEVRAEVSHYWQQVENGRPVEGATALAFGSFVGPAHATEVGHIVSLANDPEMQASVARGVWSDPCSLRGVNLLAVFRSGQGAVHAALDGFKVTAPVGVELTSLARFMEYFRALNFERVLRGALLQRWGDRVRLPLRRLLSVERSIAATVLHSDDPPVHLDGRVLLHGDRLDASDWRGVAEEGGRAAGCYRVLHLHGGHPHHAPDLPAILLAQFLDAEPACHQASVLRLADERLGRAGIVCQTMAGALILENESGSERDAVVDGLRFADDTPEPGTGWPRVRVRGDVHTLDAQDLTKVLPCVRAALRSASAVLSFSEVDSEQKRAGAVSFAEWLASLLPGNSNDPEIQRLRVLALYLSRVEGNLPVGRIFYGATNARMHNYLTGISAVAIEAEERLRDHDALLWARARSDTASARSGASLRMEEADTLEALRSLNRRASDLYLSLLEEVRPGHIEALGQAVRVQHDSVVALADAVAALRTALAEQELGPAGELVFQTIACTPCLHQHLPRPGDDLLNRHQEKTVNAALEFAGREARLRTRATHLDAIEKLCGALTDDPDTLDAAERGLAGLDTVLVAAPKGGDASALRAAIMDGLHGGAELKRALDKLLVAWARFEAARRDLFAARSASCRVWMETWYHLLLDPGERSTKAGRVVQEAAGPAGTARHQVQLERFRLLTTLGQALRRQQAALHTAGLASPAAPFGNFEPGALGLLMAMQGALLSNQSTQSNRRSL